MKIYQVIEALEQFAPLPLQEGWDNAGLQVGLTAADVSGALLCLDVTEDILNEAIAKGCNLIVSHHPLIFSKLARVTDRNMVERIVYKAIKNDVVILSLHTNMDNAPGGVNYKIAEKIGLQGVEFVSPTLVGDKEKGSVVKGFFKELMEARDFVALVKREFHVECAMTNGLLPRPIKSVAICGGAGGSFLGDAVACGADAFLTGEMRYHDYFDHRDIQIVVIGHYESEQFTTEIFEAIINKQCPGVRTVVAETNTNPVSLSLTLPTREGI